MKEEDQRVAIAKICGTYKTIFVFSTSYHNNNYTQRQYQTREKAETDYKYQLNNHGNPSNIVETIDLSEIPDYLYNLNAMHEAESVMDIDELSDYAILLGIDDEIYGHNVVKASAKEKAKAFLKVFNAWID